MFIEVTTSGGRGHAQLVESCRNEAGKPRQRTLAPLGGLEPGSDVDRLIAALSRAQGGDDPTGQAASSARHPGSRSHATYRWARLPSKRCTATRKAGDSRSTTDQTTPMSSAR